MGGAVSELSRDIHAAYRDRKNQRRAMMGGTTLDDILPSRGPHAQAFSRFNPGIVEEPSLPEAHNMRHAGSRFKISR
jgi:hypothetical protein